MLLGSRSESPDLDTAGINVILVCFKSCESFAPHTKSG